MAVDFHAPMLLLLKWKHRFYSQWQKTRIVKHFTIPSRFTEKKLVAKSGYITRARGYAGYVKNKKGEMLCFSMLANNYECTPAEMKKKFEKLLIAVAELE